MHILIFLILGVSEAFVLRRMMGVYRRRMKVLDLTKTQMKSDESIETIDPQSVKHLYNLDVFKKNERDIFIRGACPIDYKPDNDLLRAFAEASVEDLGHPSNVKAIMLPSNLSEPLGFDIAANMLFERPFYDDLLAHVRKCRQGAAVIGSTGTSKSTWLYWLIYKAVQASIAKYSWPPNAQNETTPPELIIYQQRDKVYYMSLKDQTIFLGKVIDDLLLECFDKKKVMYLFEPLQEEKGPYYNHDLFILTAVSPNPIRYAGFTKQKGGANKMYMPTYTEDELVAISRKIRLYLREDDPLYELYDEDQVKARYKKYGGIIRRVLPENVDKIEDHDMDYGQAVEDVIMSGGWNSVCRLLYSTSMTKIGSYIVQWNPKKVRNNDNVECFRFFSLEVSFATDSVVTELKSMSDKMSLQELGETLDTAIKKSYAEKVVPILFESFICSYLHPNKAPGLIEPKDLRKFARLVRGVCKYHLIEDKVLYYPFPSNFPAVEMYGKIGNQVYGIQVSVIDEAKVCENTALASFFQEIDIPPNEVETNFNLVYCRLRKSSNWRLGFARYFSCSYFVCSDLFSCGLMFPPYPHFLVIRMKEQRKRLQSII
jgi:hypothetical protein